MALSSASARDSVLPLRRGKSFSRTQAAGGGKQASRAFMLFLLALFDGFCFFLLLLAQARPLKFI
jgi:hypothetical protein